MTKKRKIKILELMKRIVIEWNFDGLCNVKNFLFNNKKITDKENKFLIDLIYVHRPRTLKYLPYYWERRKKAPRINWINKRIKELQ